MSQIIELPEVLANQIAAGGGVERPACWLFLTSDAAGDPPRGGVWWGPRRLKKKKIR